jgi:nucleoside diphosphate kinase
MDKEKVDKAAFTFDPADTMAGFEQMDSSTKSVPFLRIVQSLSPQRKSDRAEFIPGIEEGMLFNTLTKQIVEKPVRCIVLNYEHVYIEWKPARQGFVTYHSIENAKRIAVDPTKFGKWYVKGTGDGVKEETMNVLQENYVYALILEGYEAEGPIVFSLSSSMLKSARNWNRLMTTHILTDGSLAKPYYLIWNLDTEHVKKDMNDWFVPAITFDRVISDEKMYLNVKQERLALPDKRIDYAQIEGPGEDDEERIASAQY